MSQPNQKRFLVINPNTSALTTGRLQEVLATGLPENVHLDFTTASFGASYIACEASHCVASHACLVAWAEHHKITKQPIDGVLIGCFGDPGLFALREIAAEVVRDHDGSMTAG